MRSEGGVQPAKVRIPAVRHEVPPRLTAVLDGLTDGVASLVAAPGYGRTSVAAAAARSARGPVAWVSLDPFDDAPGRLWDHLEAALDGASPDAGDAAGGPGRRPEGVAGLDHVLARMAGIPELLVVLDDVHHLRGTAVRGELAYLASRLPGGVGLVLTSRTDQADLLAAAQAAGAVPVLDERHLALTDDEATASLVAGGVDPADPALGQILALARGWARAVAQVARTASGSGHDRASWLRGVGSAELLGSWWDDLPADGRAFLLDTAGLARLQPAPCDLLLDRADSSERLLTLVHDHAFLRPEADAQGLLGWRRHPILDSLLAQRLGARQVGPDRHHAVATWAADRGDIDTAVRHFMAAGDEAAALAVVLEHEDALMADRQVDEVLSWYALLPPSAAIDEAGLLLRQGWAFLLAGDVPEARALHGRLEALVADPGSPASTRRELSGEAAVLAANLAAYEADPVAVIEQCERAAACFGAARTRNAQAVVPILAARALLWLGRTRQAERVLAAEAGRPAPSRLVGEVLWPGIRGSVDLAHGRVLGAVAHAERALAAAGSDAATGSPLGTTAAHLCRGLAKIDLGEPAGARGDLELCVEASQRDGMLTYDVLGRLGLARTEELFGDPLTALAYTGSARALLASKAPRSPLVHRVNASEASIRLSLGDAARAEHLLELLPSSPATTLLDVRLSQLRRPGSGTARLEGLREADPRTAAERDVLLAAASLPTHSARAATWLLRAADVAAPHGLHAVLVGRSHELVELARSVARRTTHDGLSTLVAVADSATARPLEASGHLSAGERELLTLLAGHESNGQIAARLSVSVNTIKTRLRRLYAKLDVTDRSGAVAVARDRGLIR